MLTRFLVVRRVTPTDLREVVDAMPLHLRIAMLDGVRHERIIAGAYTDDRTGMCPMLAAHRRGARCSHPTFAPAWDAFAEAPRRRHRPADPIHVAHLARTLRASIEAELRIPTEPRRARSAAGASPAMSPDRRVDRCAPSETNRAGALAR